MELKKGHYHIQGVNISKIASEFGTPLYVYDAEKIVYQLQSLKNALSIDPRKSKIIPSTKGSL